MDGEILTLKEVNPSLGGSRARLRQASCPTPSNVGLRITIIVSLFPALSETFVLDQVISLIEMGHDVRIIADSPRSESAVHEEVEQFDLLSRTRYLRQDPRPFGSRFRVVAAAVRICRWHMINSIRAFRRARKYSGEAGEVASLAATIVALAEMPPPDVILCHFGPNGSRAVRARDALQWTTPVVTIFHGYDLSRLIKQQGSTLYDNLCRRGDLFLPACVDFADRLLRLGFPSDKVMVQRMCVDLPSFDAATPILKSGGTRCDLFTFTTLGRLVEKKGHVHAIEAFARAFAHTAPGMVRLRIIGDGPLRDELEIVARRLGVSEHIEFLGSLRRRDVISALLATDALIQPSITASDGDMEASPVVIAEAMALRKPVIGTSHSGIPELISQNVTGRIVGEGDIAALATAMTWMVENRIAASGMGDAGRRRIQDGFVAGDWNSLLEQRLQRVVVEHRFNS